METTDPVRAVVITGASTGIGRAAALELDRRGFRVFAGVRREADAHALRANASPRLEPVILDVTDAASVAAARARVEASLGNAGLAGLVNNAGVAISGPLEFLPLDAVRQQFEVNVIGTLATIQQFAPLLRRAKGRVVNVGSVGGFLATHFGGPYCASKFAIEGLSDSLRRELAPWGIEVSVIQPGSVDTPIWEKGKAGLLQWFDALPEAALELYQPLADDVIRATHKTAARAVPASLAAEKVCAALEATRPRTRYLVGMDALVIRALTWTLPDRAIDWFLRSMLR